MKIKIISTILLSIYIAGCATTEGRKALENKNVYLEEINNGINVESNIQGIYAITDRNNDKKGDLYFKLLELKEQGYEVKYSKQYLIEKAEDREYYKIYTYLAKEQIRLGNKEEGIKYFEKAIDINEDLGYSFFEYGKSLLSIGERHKGIYRIKKASLIGKKEASCLIYNSMKSGEINRDGDYYYHKANCNN